MVTKNAQIIIRLSEEKKEKLQEIADNMEIDMSKLIRDKIDEIIKIYDTNNSLSKMIVKSSYSKKTKDNLIKELENMQNKFNDIIDFINKRSE